MNYAVIDMGTNVFGLLMAEDGPEGFRFRGEYKVAARLGDGGLASGQLSEQAFASAARAFEQILGHLQACGGTWQIVGVATSAFREAANGEALQAFLVERFGVPVHIVSGDQEALLIAKGILSAHPDVSETALLMDIGGGSNEFILVRDEKILWKRSFPLGMARMLERFVPADPIAPETVATFQTYCKEQLRPLQEVIVREQPRLLIGSSGSFETFRDLLTGTRAAVGQPDFVPAMTFETEALRALFARLLVSRREERVQWPCMTHVRADFIVLAALFTDCVWGMMPAGTVIKQSSYSLKEGAMMYWKEKQEA